MVMLILFTAGWLFFPFFIACTINVIYPISTVIMPTRKKAATLGLSSLGGFVLLALVLSPFTPQQDDAPANGDPVPGLMIISLILAYFIYRQIKKHINKPKQPTTRTERYTSNFVPTPPKSAHKDDQVIYDDELHIAGAFYRQESVQNFLACKNKSIKLQPEPDNDYDPKAIKVIGYDKTTQNIQEHHIGYIPREQAQALSRMSSSERIYAANHPMNDDYDDADDLFDDDMYIAIRIIGPKSGFKEYQRHIKQAFIEMTSRRRQMLNS